MRKEYLKIYSPYDLVEEDWADDLKIRYKISYLGIAYGKLKNRSIAKLKENNKEVFNDKSKKEINKIIHARMLELLDSYENVGRELDLYNDEHKELEDMIKSIQAKASEGKAYELPCRNTNKFILVKSHNGDYLVGININEGNSKDWKIEDNKRTRFFNHANKKYKVEIVESKSRKYKDKITLIKC